MVEQDGKGKNSRLVEEVSRYSTAKVEKKRAGFKKSREIRGGKKRRFSTIQKEQEKSGSEEVG
jgi:hypothetical protein